MAHEQLRALAQMLVSAIHSSATIDWTKKSVRAKMRLEVRKLLARYGYPPDLQRAVDFVIQQAESLSGTWS
jgi:type I restriction enzyme R subunit